MTPGFKLGSTSNTNLYVGKRKANAPAKPCFRASAFVSTEHTALDESPTRSTDLVQNVIRPPADRNEETSTG